MLDGDRLANLAVDAVRVRVDEEFGRQLADRIVADVIDEKVGHLLAQLLLVRDLGAAARRTRIVERDLVALEIKLAVPNNLEYEYFRQLLHCERMHDDYN